jgi:hypothetical protein
MASIVFVYLVTFADQNGHFPMIGKWDLSCSNLWKNAGEKQIVTKQVFKYWFKDCNSDHPVG